MIRVPLKCDCHDREVLAWIEPEAGRILIRDRRHGERHSATISLPREIVVELVRLHSDGSSVPSRPLGPRE